MKENESKEDHENRKLVYELTGIRDESIHIKPYADMIEKLTYVQKADFAKHALDLERDLATYKAMFEEVSRSRNEWIKECQEHKYEIETLRGQIIDRDMEIKELKEDLEELSDTLGLRNRSNPDLTIDDEPKSLFDKWKECKD